MNREEAVSYTHLPTGLLDPKVEVRPIEGQIDDLVAEVNKEIEKKNKVLITTLTKRMAEDLTDYMKDLGIRVRYLHSDIDTLERAEIIRDMRLDVFDVLVGINLLREGLDKMCIRDSSELQVNENDTQIHIKGREFAYTIDKRTALFTEMKFAGREYLNHPMELNIWRAPTDNDMYIKSEWKKAHYDKAYTRAYTCLLYTSRRSCG